MTQCEKKKEGELIRRDDNGAHRMQKALPKVALNGRQRYKVISFLWGCKDILLKNKQVVSEEGCPSFRDEGKIRLGLGKTIRERD